MPLLNTTIEVDGVEKTFGIINSITSDLVEHLEVSVLSSVSVL